MKQTIIILIVFITLTACSNNEKPPTEPAGVTGIVAPIVVCDTFKTDRPPLKEYKKALSVWLETTSLDWFLEKRQSAWREAKAWNNRIVPVDSNAMLKCLSAERQQMFLYIPHHFYKAETNGNEKFDFFIVNNTKDSIAISMLDRVINNISSSVASLTGNEPAQWLSFQQTDKRIDCGNSLWTMKLPPRMAIQSQIESYYLNMGDTTVNYRLELSLGQQKIISNNIKINLMKKQIPFLGKSEE